MKLISIIKSRLAGVNRLAFVFTLPNGSRWIITITDEVVK